MAILLESGDLWRAILRQTAVARASGDLQPITTEVHVLEDAGVRFAVRVLGGLDRKQRASARQLDAGVDPFLPPYDDDLFVADVSETHVALLNKWCVVDHHLLVVPRVFEAQESALGVADFEALWACMMEFDALGFYNSGPEAGASQPHKHLQLVPLPIEPAGPVAAASPALPIEPLLESARLPFEYALTRLRDSPHRSPAVAGRVLADVYRELLAEVELDGCSLPRGPYNLLVTREWMLVVPRSCEAWEGVSVNALGFAGALLVPSLDDLVSFSKVGPLEVLARVARPIPPSEP